MAPISACLALLLLGQQPQQPPSDQTAPSPATATIRGHVTAGGTGQALRKAQVRLIQIDMAPGTPNGARENRLATTDADGKFEVTGLPAGRYNVNAAKPGYVGLSWGQQQPNEAGKPIVVLTGQTIERVDFTLPRGGVITGRIFDEFSEPLSGIQVGAMRYASMNGQRQLMPTGRMATTDDLGEFRLYGIAPGQYYVQATWRRMGPGDPNSADRTGYPTTFFPGTLNVSDALRITVGIGQTVSDLVMAMSPIRTARVEGTLVDSNGRPMGGAILLIMQEFNGNGVVSSGSAVRPDGTFTFASLAPGDYTLRTQPTPGGGSREVALMKLTVSSEDIKDLRLVASSPSTITGRVVIDPTQATALPTVALSLMAMPMGGPMMGPVAPARVADDLTFELSASPGATRLNVLNMPMGWTIRAVRANGVDVIDTGLDVRPNEDIENVEVELTNRVTTLSGLVTNTGGEASKDYTVLVFAADDKKWTPGSRYFRSARPDQDGRFKITALPPGDYNVIALDRVDQGQSTDPEFLDRIRSKATSLSLIEGETKSVDLRINSAS